jgi:diguanylate cyclase (GGDEF)-like protein
MVESGSYSSLNQFDKEETPQVEDYYLLGMAENTAQNAVEKTKELEAENKKLKEQAFVDEMTGLQSSNAWAEYIKHFDGNRGDNTTFILCDLNNLKKTNDNFGHSEGNILLKKSANFIKNVFSRSHDKIFRIGGDEFIISIENIRTSEERKKLEDFVNNNFSKKNLNKGRVNFSY